MKMVKSLLLGTAAGIMAVAGAQAADLPVKAKPVEYVKVCSLYGAGFYYMPGTDICLKIGGYVRAQYTSWGGQTGTVNNWTGGPANNRFNQAEDLIFRVRVIASFDTRQQTEYGTLRTYMNLGYTHDAMAGNAAGTSAFAGAGIYVNRGFIQLAGFTFGKAQSFFDILGTSSVSYFAWPASDSGDGGKNLAAYTAQFGNGFSGTLSIEEVKRTAVINGQFQNTLTPATINNSAATVNNYGNSSMPDFVANLRVDQAWGSAQIMGAVHQVRATYYGAAASANVLEGSGHPEDEYGWVIGGGVQLNASMISPGDKFQLQASYTEGALRYMADTQASGLNYARLEGLTGSFGAFSDGVYTGTNAANGSSIDLTKGWQVSATYDHVWSQKWKTSLYGGILAVDYSNTAGNALCNAYNIVPTVGAANCDADWSTWWIGSRTQFNINASTYMGVDVLYTKLNTAAEGGNILLNPAVGKPGGIANLYTLRDMENLGVTFRVHRDFLP